MTTKLMRILRRRPGSVMVVLWIALTIACASKGLKRGPTYDFMIYVHAAEATSGGQPLYDASTWDEKYLYSPAYAILSWPFTLPSPELSYILWTALSIAALYLAAWSCRAAFCSDPGFGPSLWAPLLGLIALYQCVTSNVLHGNSNAFPLLAIALSLHQLSRGRSFSAGSLVALAAMVKLTPLLFALWFIVRRDVRGLVGMAAGTALWLVLIPVAVLGLDTALFETRGWIELVLRPAFEGEFLEEAGQSVPRMIGAIANALELDDGAQHPVARIASRLASAGLLGTTLWFAWRRRHHGLETFSLLVLAIQLAQPISRNGSFVLAVPAMVLCCMQRREGGFAAGRLAAIGVVAAVTMLLLGRVVADSSKAFFPTTAMTVIVWTGWMVRLARVPAQGDVEAEPDPAAR